MFGFRYGETEPAQELDRLPLGGRERSIPGDDRVTQERQRAGGCQGGIKLAEGARGRIRGLR